MHKLFFRNKTFLFLKIMSWNFQHLIILGFQLIWTTFIFQSPCYYLSSNSVSNMGCFCSRLYGTWKFTFIKQFFLDNYSREETVCGSTVSKKLRLLHSNCTDSNICKHIIYPRDCCFLLHNSTAASTCWKLWLLKFCNQNRIFQGIRKKSCNISSCCNNNITAANVITTSLCLCGLQGGKIIFDIAWVFHALMFSQTF